MKQEGPIFWCNLQLVAEKKTPKNEAAVKVDSQKSETFA